MKQQSTPRSILNLIGIGTAISLLGDATLYTVLPRESTAIQVGVTLGMVGTLLGINRATRILLNLPIGHIFDRFSRRGLMVLAMFLAAVSTLLYAIGYGFPILLIARILWGIAWAFISIGGNAMLLDLANNKNRFALSSQLNSWFFFGVAASSLLGGVLTDLIGFRATLFFSAGMTALAGIAWLIKLPETSRAQTPEEELEEKTDSGQMKRNILLLAVITFTTRFITWGVMSSTAILWLERMFGEQIQLLQISIPLASFTGIYKAALLGMTILGSQMAHYFIPFYAHNWKNISTSLMFSTFTVALMSLPNPLFALLGAFATQFSEGNIKTILPTLLGENTVHQQRGRALGVIYSIGDLGATLGPVFALFMIEKFQGTMKVVFLPSAALMLLTCLAAAFFSRSKDQAKRNSN